MLSRGGIQLGPVWQGFDSSKNGSDSGSSDGAAFLMELKPFWKTFGKTASPWIEVVQCLNCSFLFFFFSPFSYFLFSSSFLFLSLFPLLSFLFTPLSIRPHGLTYPSARDREVFALPPLPAHAPLLRASTSRPRQLRTASSRLAPPLLGASARFRQRLRPAPPRRSLRLASSRLACPPPRALLALSFTGRPLHRGKGVKGRRSQLEPRFRGSTSPVEVVRGSTGSSMAGTAPPRPVWQGSAWSPSWSPFWSPAKHPLNFNRRILPYIFFQPCISCYVHRKKSLLPPSQKE
jgi:hypothetical protein